MDNHLSHHLGVNRTVIGISPGLGECIGVFVIRVQRLGFEGAVGSGDQVRNVALSFSWFLTQRRTEAALSAELIDAHVRSLQPGHLTDVESTDQHSVKPWFDGKLAFIPPVADYSGQGFPLLGGRLDVLEGESIAALVYGRRKHIINLFVWPATGRKHPGDASGSRQGYNWRAWRSGDMQYCLVSDVSAADLQTLQSLIRR